MKAQMKYCCREDCLIVISVTLCCYLITTTHKNAIRSLSLHFFSSTVSHSYGYGLLDAGALVALAQNWTSVGPQRQCVNTMLSEPRLEGWLGACVCGFVRKKSFSIVTKTSCSIISLTLMDVAAFSSKPGRSLKFKAQCCSVSISASTQH